MSGLFHETFVSVRGEGSSLSHCGFFFLSAGLPSGLLFRIVFLKFDRTLEVVWPVSATFHMRRT